MKKTGFFLLLLVSTYLSASPTIEDYGRLPTVQQMAISPNGDLIAYRQTTTGLDALFVASLSEGKRLNAVDVSNVKPQYIKFLGNKQVYLRASEVTRVAGFRGKFEVSTGMSLDLKKGSIKQMLIPGDGVVYPGQQGLGNIVGLSPDGKYAYMPAYYGDPQHFGGKSISPSYSLLRVRANGSGKARRHVSGSQEANDFFVNSEGNPVAREDYDNTKNLHLIYSRKGKKWQEIFREETSYRYRAFVGLTKDQKHLVMLDTRDETGRTAYYTMALEDGAIAGPFHDRNDADIVSVVSDLQRVAHGVKYSGLVPTYTFFDAALDKRVKAIQSNFPDHAVHITDFSPDWKHILVLVEGSQASGDYYLFSEGKKSVFITSRRPNIKPGDMNPLGTVTFTARDGLKIPTIITIPKASLSNMKNLPAVVLPHGGPASYDQIGFDSWAQALAQQGYMVIMPQFRGSEGFGRDHEIAGFGEWGRKMQHDISDAVDFFAKKGMIDPERVCIAGGSYGGYAALAGGAFTPEKYKCVVSINGIANLKKFRTWIRSERGKSSGSLAYWETQIGGQDYSNEIALERSPEISASAFKAPVLLIHAKRDEIVPIAQSRDMHKILKRAGKTVDFIQLEGDDHHLSQGETRLEALKATVEFIKKHI